MHLHRPWRTVAPCAEFPNDNPALHSGAIWRCTAVNGAASCDPPGAIEAQSQPEAGPVQEPTPTAPTTVFASEPAHDPVPVSAEPLASEEASADSVPDFAAASVEEATDDPIDDAADDPIDGAADDYEIDVVDDLEFEDDIVEEGLPASAADAISPDGTPGDCPSAEEEATALEMVPPEMVPPEMVPPEMVPPAVVPPTVVPPSEGSCARLCSDDPFAKLREVLEDVARASGSSAESVRCIGALLGGARLDASTVSAACAEALVAGGQLQAGEHGLRRAPGFAREVDAWQGILRGESDDFSACGAAMLDEWCANLLARVMGNPSRAETFRRELRRRGVAAFGLVEDAA